MVAFLNMHQLKVIVGVLDLRIHYVWHVKSLSAFQGWNVTKSECICNLVCTFLLVQLRMAMFSGNLGQRRVGMVVLGLLDAKPALASLRGL